MQSLLHFVRWRLGLDAAEHWMDAKEAACLLRHATGKSRLAEIGVWEGGSTRRIRELMAPGATLFAVDPYAPGRLGVSYQRLIAHGEVSRIKNGSVIWLRETGAEAARRQEVTAAPFDFVFLDGDHTYDGLRRDWEGWAPLVAARGVIALHDSVLPKGHVDAGSVRYSSEVVVCDPRFEIVDEVVSLRVLRRR